MAKKLKRIYSTYSFKSKHHIIHLVYESSEDKVRFNDYFYYNVNDISDIIRYTGIEVDTDKEYKSLYGDKVYKVYYTDIKNKNDIKRRFAEKAHMIDVKPERKYLNLHQDEIEWSHNRHILFFDIETNFDMEHPKWNNPDKAQLPITSIQLYSTMHDKYYIFSWHPEIEEMEIINNEDTVYCIFEKEKDMLYAFVKHFKNLDPDIISGWYSDDYDIPYVYKRLKYNKMNPDKLSPGGYFRSYKNRSGYYTNIIKGIDNFDLLQGMQQFNYKLPNNKLNTAAEVILDQDDEEASKYDKASWKNWLSDFKGFLKYGKRDVELLNKISKKTEMFDFCYILQEYVNSERLNIIFQKSIFTECYFMKAFDEIYPTVYYHKRRKYKGAFVRSPEYVGKTDNVAIFDYSSLYPTVAIAFNISPETFLISKEIADKNDIDIDKVVEELKENNIPYVDSGYDESLFGKRYIFLSQKAKEGVVPRAERYLYNERKKLKSEMKELNKKDDKYDVLDKKQYAIKIVLNSMYGAMAFPFYRFYKPECSDMITFFGRKLFKYAEDYFNEEFELETLYADTDSCFVMLDNKDINSVIDNMNINDKIKKDIVNKHNPDIPDDYYMINLEFEKLLKSVFFADSKKRYFGIDSDNKTYVKGMNIIRKNTPRGLRDDLTRLSRETMENKFSVESLLKLRKNIEQYDYKDIGAVKSFHRAFDQYENIAQHVKAAEFANNKFDCNIKAIDNPYMFYVIYTDDNGKNHNTAICLLEDDFDIFDKHDNIEIDYDTFFDKQIITPIEEFDLIEDVKTALVKYMLKNKEYYNKFFSRAKRIIKKIKQSKPLTCGIYEWTNKYNKYFKFSNYGEIKLKE